MRAILTRAAIAAACAFAFLTPAAEAQQAHPEGWIVRGEEIARRIQTEDLVITDAVRTAREQDARRAHGEERLQILYDLAADDYVASNAALAADSVAAFEREARAQNNARFLTLVEVLRGYAPALQGDYVAVRRNLTQQLESTEDVVV